VLSLIRMACRLALAAACAALFMLWIEPHWEAEKRTLELRVRRGPEVLKAARALAGRVRGDRDRDRDLPEVASGKESGSDELTDEDRRLLQRLLEEKLRE
jgi:hypothetical protein